MKKCATGINFFSLVVEAFVLKGRNNIIIDNGKWRIENAG